MPLTIRNGLNLTFQDQLTEHSLLSEGEAIEILLEVADEQNIDLGHMSAQSKQDFIDVIRYTPHTIPTEQIAREVGLIPRTEGTTLNRNSVGISAQGLQYLIDDSDPFRNVDLDRILSNYANATRPTPEPQSAPVFFSSSHSNAYSVSSAMPTLGSRKKQPQRSERDMMAQIVRSEGFPRPNFIDWSNNRELQNIIDDWYRNVEYKEQWIFSRREREGFNRRNIGYFNLDDVMSRLNKRRKPHELDTEKSKFYDWKLGGTEWILRLELYQHEQHQFLISRYIHKPSNAEIKYDVRYWNGEKFVMVNGIVSEHRNADLFERVFGSLDENSDYYIAPYEQDEDDFDTDFDTDYVSYEVDDWDDN
jgi:hypothetical protein